MTAGGRDGPTALSQPPASAFGYRIRGLLERETQAVARSLASPSFLARVFSWPNAERLKLSLPSLRVTALFEKDGFLYIGTDEGLTRWSVERDVQP